MEETIAIVACVAIIVLISLGLMVVCTDVYISSASYTCTRYEIIGESPDRHEVCAVYERKDGV